MVQYVPIQAFQYNKKKGFLIYKDLDILKKMSWSGCPAGTAFSLLLNWILFFVVSHLLIDINSVTDGMWTSLFQQYFVRSSYIISRKSSFCIYFCNENLLLSLTIKVIKSLSKKSLK